MNEDNENMIIEKYKKIVKEKKQIVTVFLTSSNRKKYIVDAIDSILHQDYQNFCFIILDNNSTDGTVELLDSYVDEKIFLIQRESKLDYSNFMYSFSICATKYMVVFHDDDIIEKQYLSTMLPVMEKKSIQLLSPSANIIDENGETVRRPSNTEGIYSGEQYLKSFLKKSRNTATIWFPANMYQTEFYRNICRFVDYYGAGPATDQYLVLQTERYGGRIGVVSDRLLNYRVHRSQSASIMSGIMELWLIKFLKRDAYYSVKIKENKKIIYKYIKSAYKALAINYSNHKDRSIRKYLKMEKTFYSGLGWKTRFYCIIYNFSYVFFKFTIVPYANWIRLKKNE